MDATYTCERDGCPNGGVPVPVDATPGSRVVCGGCQGVGAATEPPAPRRRRAAS